MPCILAFAGRTQATPTLGFRYVALPYFNTYIVVSKSSQQSAIGKRQEPRLFPGHTTMASSPQWPLSMPSSSLNGTGSSPGIGSTVISGQGVVKGSSHAFVGNSQGSELDELLPFVLQLTNTAEVRLVL
jgi:hypothetical protein